MKKFSLHLLLVSCILALSTVQCGGSKSLLSSGSSLMDALAKNPTLSTISGLLKAPGLNKVLGDALKSPFTLLAPTDDAFNALGSSAVADLAKPENLNQLAALLKNHIVPGKSDAATLMKGGISTASGNPLNLSDANLGSVISEKDFNVIPVDKVLK
ncbi:MAG TPA: fasciclin domain-containing protein [Chitinophagaceae bacterium]|jgi:uncharacterized surface protein with fasciclin (FAS1) repeats